LPLFEELGALEKSSLNGHEKTYFTKTGSCPCAFIFSV
jgi:hypothetical protein